MPVYLGATNENGYKMFNVNLMQERLERPMTIEMIPNYCHSNFSEIQYMDFLMWVSHVFDGRPITQISDVSHQRQPGRTIFRAKIESDAKIQIARTCLPQKLTDAPLIERRSRGSLPRLWEPAE